MIRKILLTLIEVLLLTGCSNTSLSNGTPYAVAGLDFSVNLPQGWMESSYTDDLTHSGTVDIDFSNMPQPEGQYDVSNVPEGFQVINLRVYDMKNKGFQGYSGYLDEFLPRVDSYERKDILGVTAPIVVSEYQTTNDEYITMYIYETETTWETHAKVYAEAFYKGQNFAYNFWLGFGSDDLESGREMVETVLKPMLESFEDLSN